jgi:hypothetical protein
MYEYQDIFANVDFILASEITDEQKSEEKRSNASLTSGSLTLLCDRS